MYSMESRQIFAVMLIIKLGLADYTEPQNRVLKGNQDMYSMESRQIFAKNQ